MSFNGNAAARLQAVRENFQRGRLAHAYVIHGASLAEGKRFAMEMVRLVLCENQEGCGHCPDCRRVDGGRHPDVTLLEPESKSRQIVVDNLHDLIRRFSQTSFEGGWKVGLVLAADRMTDSASNAFLKTLEEPAPRTLILLVTENDQALLKTIRSRCQLIALAGEGEQEEEPWREPVLALLRRGHAESLLEASSHAAYLQALLDALKEQARQEEVGEEEEEVDKKVREARENARLLEVRHRILAMMMQWYRDVLLAVLGVDPGRFHFPEEREVVLAQARGLTYGRALKRIRGLERAAHRLERNLPSMQIFEQFFSGR